MTFWVKGHIFEFVGNIKNFISINFYADKLMALGYIIWDCRIAEAKFAELRRYLVTDKVSYGGTLFLREEKKHFEGFSEKFT